MMQELCLKSAEVLAKIMTVTVFEAAGLTVSEKTETMLLRTPDQSPCTSPLVIEAASQRYRQTTHFLYLGGLIGASADIMPEIKRWVRLEWACYSRFERELYDMEAAPFALTLRMLKAEVMETLLYGCVRWTLGKEHFDELQTAHHRFLLRIVGFQRRQRTDHLMSYAMAQCESVETTICKRGASDGAPGAGNGTGTYPYQHRPLAGALARQF